MNSAMNEHLTFIHDNSLILIDLVRILLTIETTHISRNHDKT